MNANPTYDDLVCRRTGKTVRASYAQGMHRNPRLYKYMWLVFDNESVEGEAFFKTPKLCTFEAMARMKKLTEEDKGYLVYNWSRPRLDPASPLNFEHPKWKWVLKAPAFEDDPDPEWQGHK